jgi:hypothetical protein
VLAGGVGVGTIEKVKKLIQEKTEKIQKLGDEAWKKRLEQAKPYLDKNPKVKEIIESNADSLKNGDFSELFEKAKDAASSGNTESTARVCEECGGEGEEEWGWTEQYAVYEDDPWW